jgi:hypothetical protein
MHDGHQPPLANGWSRSLSGFPSYLERATAWTTPLPLRLGVRVSGRSVATSARPRIASQAGYWNALHRRDGHQPAGGHGIAFRPLVDVQRNRAACGRHGTAGGACIIDTPGLRTLRLDGDAAVLGVAFADVAKLAGGCRFRDCQHADEPGCAVRGTVSDERLNNYNKLLREARRDTLTAWERKVQVQQWKARGRQTRIRAEMKRG